MSFSVDLWNGFDLIKIQYNSIHKKLKSLNSLLSTYCIIETEYCRNLENLYREYKDNTKPEFLLDESVQKIIEIFNNEIQHRRTLNNYIAKNIIEQVNAYLAIPKTKYNKCFSDNNENKAYFNKSLTTLIEKQNLFHAQCKELGSYIAQMEMDTINKTNKTSKAKCQKVLEKTKSDKEEYLNCLKETNRKRENYNNKTEEILQNLEEMYTGLVEKLKDSIYNFTKKRVKFLKKLYEKEQKEYSEIHSKIVSKDEVLSFIKKHATKEFPMVKFEFCPIKYIALNKYIKNKYSKISKEELPKIYKSIQNYLDNNEIFKDEIIFKSNKKQSDSFTRRISFFTRKAPQLNINEAPVEKTEMQKNKEFLEKYLTDLFKYNSKQKKKDNKNEDNQSNQEKNNSKVTNGIEKKGNKDSGKNKEKDNIIEENLNILNECNININQEQKENENKNLEKVENLIKNKNENHLFYVEVLIKKLSYLRSKGIFEIDQYAYITVLILFDIIIKENPKNDYILKNILILCHTFYKLVDDEKIYLQEGIKNRDIFKNPETWHRVINYSMILNNTDKDLNNFKSNEIIEKIKKECDVVVISYLCDMTQFTDEEKVFNDVKNYYIQVYNLDENKINTELNNYKKSIEKKNNNTEKEKDKIIQEIKSGIIDIKDNQGDTNTTNSESSIVNENCNKEENKEISEIKYEIEENKIIEKNKEANKEILEIKSEINKNNKIIENKIGETNEISETKEEIKEKNKIEENKIEENKIEKNQEKSEINNEIKNNKIIESKLEENQEKSEIKKEINKITENIDEKKVISNNNLDNNVNIIVKEIIDNIINTIEKESKLVIKEEDITNEIKIKETINEINVIRIEENNSEKLNEGQINLGKTEAKENENMNCNNNKIINEEEKKDENKNIDIVLKKKETEIKEEDKNKDNINLEKNEVEEKK